MLPTNIYYISLERSLYSASARVSGIKIHAEIKELLQLASQRLIFLYSLLPALFDSLFTFSL